MHHGGVTYDRTKEATGTGHGCGFGAKMTRKWSSFAVGFVLLLRRLINCNWAMLGSFDQVRVTGIRLTRLTLLERYVVAGRSVTLCTGPSSRLRLRLRTTSHQRHALLRIRHLRQRPLTSLGLRSCTPRHNWSDQPYPPPSLISPSRATASAPARLPQPPAPHPAVPRPSAPLPPLGPRHHRTRRRQSCR